MDFDENINCNTCKHGYFKNISWDGCLCGANNCYLCAQKCEYCDDYEAGDVPEEKKPMQITSEF